MCDASPEESCLTCARKDGIKGIPEFVALLEGKRKCGQHYTVLYEQEGKFVGSMEVVLDRSPRCLDEGSAAVPTVRLVKTEVHGRMDGKELLRVEMILNLLEALAGVPCLQARHLYYESAVRCERGALEILCESNVFKTHPFNKGSYISVKPCGSFKPSKGQE